MSIGPSHLAGSVSGSQLPQARGSELDRNRDDAAQQSAQAEATKASGADGALQENGEAADRDGDGRSFGSPTPPKREDQDLENKEESNSTKSLDPSGDRGGNLDLTG